MLRAKIRRTDRRSVDTRVHYRFTTAVLCAALQYFIEISALCRRVRAGVKGKNPQTIHVPILYDCLIIFFIVIIFQGRGQMYVLFSSRKNVHTYEYNDGTTCDNNIIFSGNVRIFIQESKPPAASPCVLILCSALCTRDTMVLPLEEK